MPSLLVLLCIALFVATAVFAAFSAKGLRPRDDALDTDSDGEPDVPERDKAAARQAFEDEQRRRHPEQDEPPLG